MADRPPLLRCERLSQFRYYCLKGYESELQLLARHVEQLEKKLYYSLRPAWHGGTDGWVALQVWVWVAAAVAIGVGGGAEMLDNFLTPKLAPKISVPISDIGGGGIGGPVGGWGTPWS